MDIAQYIEFLNKLLSYGPKIGPVMEEVAGLVDEFMTRLENVRMILGLEKGPMMSVAVTDDVLNLEEQVIAAATGGLMAGPLQDILAFVRANPELLKILLLLLK